MDRYPFFQLRIKKGAPTTSRSHAPHTHKRVESVLRLRSEAGSHGTGSDGQTFSSVEQWRVSVAQTDFSGRLRLRPHGRRIHRFWCVRWAVRAPAAGGEPTRRSGGRLFSSTGPVRKIDETETVSCTRKITIIKGLYSCKKFRQGTDFLVLRVKKITTIYMSLFTLSVLQFFFQKATWVFCWRNSLYSTK